MTTFQPTILQCRLCKQKMFSFELTSYTVYSSTGYSDGKTDTKPFIDNEKAIAICPSCNQAFWVEDALVETENAYDLIDTVPKALDILDLSSTTDDNPQHGKIVFYEKLLKQGFAYNTEKKYYLRVRMWWAINDLLRYQLPFFKFLMKFSSLQRFRKMYKNRQERKKLFNGLKEVFDENLLRLIALTDQKYDDEIIMKAEMYRELGEFGEAGKTINKLEDTRNSVARKIKKEIFFRKKRVVKI